MCYPVFQTKVNSFTGPVLYSDNYCFYERNGNGYRTITKNIPVLNKFAAFPVIGIAIGVMRVALAVLHILMHTLAGIFSDREHFYHVIKGSAELLRGLIEALPVIGRIFVWFYDAGDYTEENFNVSSNGPDPAKWSFFLVKIYNSENPDEIDRRFVLA